MTELEYDGLRALYYQFQELSAKYDSLKLKVALKDTAISLCMQSRDSLIVDNLQMQKELRRTSDKLIDISDDLSKLEDSVVVWKTVGISSSVCLVIVTLILIAG